MRLGIDIQRPAARRLIATAAFAAALALAPATVSAQSLGENIAGMTQKTDQPIDIQSDTLEVLDDEKRAIFRGNVVAVQGGMTLRSRKLLVNYDGGEGLSGSNSRITKIRADGKVLITTEKKQTTTSDWAIFDVKSQAVTIGGNVVLSQGENMIKGDRLIIDLKTGRSRFEHDGQVAEKKRVRGIFKPKQATKSEQSDANAGQ